VEKEGKKGRKEEKKERKKEKKKKKRKEERRKITCPFTKTAPQSSKSAPMIERRMIGKFLLERFFSCSFKKWA